MAQEPRQPRAVRTTAPYSFWGMLRELEKGAPLDTGETVQLAGYLKAATGWGLIQRPCFMRLTPRRLVLVMHYAFQPDQLLTIPAGALLEVSLMNEWIRLRIRTTEGEDTISVRTIGSSITSRPRMEDFYGGIEEDDVDAPGLVAALESWGDQSPEGAG